MYHLETGQYPLFLAKIWNFKGQCVRNYWSDFDRIRNVCISM